MSSTVRLFNWQGIAPSNFKWAADFRDIIVGDVFYLMLNTLPMTGVWTIPVQPGGPGYSGQITCLINVRIYNQVGTKVWDSDLVPVYFQDGKNYEFDCVYKQMLETSTPSAHISGKALQYDSNSLAIPVAGSVPLNTAAGVFFAVHNDSPDSRFVSLNIVVKRPDSSVALSTTDQSGYIDSGGNYITSVYSLALDQVGDWTITLTLSIWDGSQWLVTDSWQGALCTVVGAAQPSFTNLQITYTKV